jgi:hypothetical protein
MYVCISIYFTYVTFFSQILVLYIELKLDDHCSRLTLYLNVWLNFEIFFSKCCQRSIHSFQSMTLWINLLLCINQNKVSFLNKESLHASLMNNWVNASTNDLSLNALATKLTSTLFTLILILSIVFIYDAELHQGPEIWLEFRVLTYVPSFNLVYRQNFSYTYNLLHT